MITIEANNIKCEIPNCWEELSAQQYCRTVELIYDMISGELSVYDFRLSLLQALTGYKRSKKRQVEKDQEQINSNLFVLADQLTFPLKPVYDDPGMLDVLNSSLQKKLKTHFPFEIFDPDFLPELEMVRDRLNYSIAINLNMKKNPLPQIDFKQSILNGPVFTIDDVGVVETDITAQQYVDAFEYYSLYSKVKKIKYLDVLTAILYWGDQQEYDTFLAQQRAKTLKDMDISIKQGVFLFFQNILEYLINTHPFKLLFNQGKKKSGGISLGLTGTIYSLSKEGYGSKQEIAEMNLADYLNLLLKQLIDAVHTLREKPLEKKNHQIAEQLNLSIETVQQI